MRYTREHKQKTRERILSAASMLLRRGGMGGASVGRVMSRAGLTVGGFYGHFASKRALVGESLRWLFARQRERWVAGLEEADGAEWLDGFVRRYLSRQHRDLADEGCPVPAVLTELPRAGAPARRALADELQVLADQLAARMEGEAPAQARARALGILALCFGGMALARAVPDRALSDEVLRACRAVALGPQARSANVPNQPAIPPHEEPA